MSRRRTPILDSAPAVALGQPHVIAPTAVYFVDTFRRIFRLRESTVRREVREGRLTVHKRAGRYFILGADVLAWLQDAPSGPPKKAGAPPSLNGHGKEGGGR